MEELLARARVVLRRKASEEPAPPILRSGDLEVDLAKQLVTRGGRPIHLTPTEYGLLEAMATNPGKLLTHQWLLRRVWGQGYGTGGEGDGVIMKPSAAPEPKFRLWNEIKAWRLMGSIVGAASHAFKIAGSFSH